MDMRVLARDLILRRNSVMDQPPSFVFLRSVCNVTNALALSLVGDRGGGGVACDKDGNIQMQMHLFKFISGDDDAL
ncbi:hypothetical protein VNO78_15698 [Psophocarpus tetragonolobus]|uniref:Uncharacterized protein n=1 Tax=Psophocarpus tetragonolobus TaxID=3891 RepID=A0AAN9SJ94_PSOTE